MRPISRRTFLAAAGGGALALGLTRLGFRIASTGQDIVYTYYPYTGWD